MERINNHSSHNHNHGSKETCMYVNRMILLVVFGVFMLPPLLAQLAMHVPHGWLMPAGLWGLIIISCFWIVGAEQHTHG